MWGARLQLPIILDVIFKRRSPSKISSINRILPVPQVPVRHGEGKPNRYHAQYGGCDDHDFHRVVVRCNEPSEYSDLYLHYKRTIDDALAYGIAAWV